MTMNISGMRRVWGILNRANRHWKIMKVLKASTSQTSHLGLSGHSLPSLPADWPKSYHFHTPSLPYFACSGSFVWHKVCFPSTLSLCHVIDRIAFSHPWIHFLPTLLGMLLEILIYCGVLSPAWFVACL